MSGDHPAHPEIDDLHGGRWQVRSTWRVDLGGCTLGAIGLLGLLRWLLRDRRR